MNNPFEALQIEPDVELLETQDEFKQKLSKRDAIYKKYDPMVNEVLEQFIAAHRQGQWEKDSDCSRRYCCHVAWFAGPREKFLDPYDIHHTLRRRLEVRLEMDGMCNPTGFKVTHYEAVDRIIHVGLEKDNLIRGIQMVMA